MAFKVLVFSEPGISSGSIDGLKCNLHFFLSPNYWIGDVNQAQLRSREWVHTCALLALPHCNDVRAYTRLGEDPEAIQQIRDFVHNGGSFLGIGGGASFASAQATWNRHRIWTKPLGLWPGTSTGPWSLEHAHAHDFAVDTSDYCYLFWDRGGEFVGGQWKASLAQYNGHASAAAIHCVSGKGNVVLWHARPEHALTAQILQESRMSSTDEDVEHAEQNRRQVFQQTLQTLRLELTDERLMPPRLPLPQLLVAQPATLPNRTQPENAFVDVWDLNPRYNGGKDVFEILSREYATPQEWANLREQSQSQSNPQSLIWVVSPHQVPPARVTPLFNIALYFDELAIARGNRQVRDQFGRYLLYGEAVTSTQSQLSGNPVIAKKLPSPLFSLATFQLKGICSSADRIWLSPYGVLQWTLMLDVPNNFVGERAHLDAAVHVVSLAVVEACRPLLAAAHRPRLGLKWPNDIYIASGAGGRPEKVGGVLVELLPEQVSGGTRRILIGCGLDVCNSRPLPALEQFADPQQRNGNLPMELVAASIMARLSIDWEQFSQNDFSFTNFKIRYTNALLHKEWDARLMTPHEDTMCTIKGVDSAGQLRIHPHSGGSRSLPAIEYSFDIHKSIISQKVPA